MHLAVRADVVIKFGHAPFVRRKDFAGFGDGPGEIVAIVVERLVGVLAGVESAARLIGENLRDPGDRSFGNFAIPSVSCGLIAVQIIFQQLGIVVRHFLEVRHAPALVHRIAMKAAADLIVKSARGHSVQSFLRDGLQLRASGPFRAFEQ